MSSRAGRPREAAGCRGGAVRAIDITSLHLGFAGPQTACGRNGSGREHARRIPTEEKESATTSESAPRKGRAVTIHEVAAAAESSPMTGWRVINGNANVRPATREQVTRAVREL